MSRGLITQWRQGLSRIQAEDARALARACGVDPGWLLAGEESGATPPPWATHMPPLKAPIEPPDRRHHRAKDERGDG